VSAYALALTKKTFGVEPATERVVYSPVTLSESRPTVFPNSADYLLYAGTIVPQKGVCVLARAASRVLAEFPSLHLVFAGRIPSEQAGIQQQLRELAGPQAAERLHFTGVLDRGSLAAFMRRARAFVFPSSLETFGLVTAEAMLAGAPVVACNCGPGPEFIRHGESGLLVPPHDPNALAGALVRLLHDPAMASRIAAEGRRTVEQNFTVERCVRDSGDVYRQVRDAHR
jgi:glycosyltransferase involved in cell wall biosynthesis